MVKGLKRTGGVEEMWNRKELKEKGKLAFKANYWWCVLVSVIIMAVTGAAGGSSNSGASGGNDEFAASLQAASSQSGMSIGVVAAVLGILAVGMIIGLLIKLFVCNPIEMGGCRFFLANSDGKAQIGDVVAAFKNGYVNVALTLFLRDLFVSLWSLLLIVPGIIKAYEYRMVPYILAEDPTIDHKEAFAKSKAMMTGQKWNAFVLDLSFIGWGILSTVTCGILGVFYVNPYIFATGAELYKTLKENA